MEEVELKRRGRVYSLNGFVYLVMLDGVGVDVLVRVEKEENWRRRVGFWIGARRMGFCVVR